MKLRGYQEECIEILIVEKRILINEQSFFQWIKEN